MTMIQPKENNKKHFLHVQDSIIQEIITNKGVSNPYSLAFELKGSDGVETYTKDGIIYVRPKWISVDDRIPEVGVEVLVYVISHGRDCDYGVNTYAENVGYEAIDKIREWEDSHPNSFLSDRFYGRVTHWMTLPAPPKDDL